MPLVRNPSKREKFPDWLVSIYDVKFNVPLT